MAAMTDGDPGDPPCKRARTASTWAHGTDIVRPVATAYVQGSKGVALRGLASSLMKGLSALHHLTRPASVSQRGPAWASVANALVLGEDSREDGRWSNPHAFSRCSTALSLGRLQTVFPAFHRRPGLLQARDCVKREWRAHRLPPSQHARPSPPAWRAALNGA
jgi:hypothetical protein